MAFRDGKETCVLCGDAGGGGGDSNLWRINVRPIGDPDGNTATFQTPQFFVHEGVGLLTIAVYRNGQRLTQYLDFTVDESVPGDGYDLIVFVGDFPQPGDILLADYVTTGVDTTPLIGAGFLGYGSSSYGESSYGDNLILVGGTPPPLGYGSGSYGESSYGD